jgi:hypothetical protein
MSRKNTNNNKTTEGENIVLPVAQRQAWLTAASLKPGISVMDGCVAGNEEAIAIREAWRLRQSRATRLVEMSQEAINDAVERTPTFGG